MNHQQAREILPIYADGELDPQRAAELEAQLAESAELRDELERWRLLRHCANRVVTAPVVPVELENTIRNRLHHAQRTKRFPVLGLFGGITAIAAVVVVMFVLWRPGPTAAESKLLAAERFAEIYRHCAVEVRHRQVEVDLQNVQAAHTTLANLVAHPVLVPDLGGSGFALDGVCRCFHAPGVEAVHVFYRRGGPEPAVVSFFSLDQKVHLRSPLSEASSGSRATRRAYEVAESEGVTVCKWDEPTNSFAVCSEMSRQQLRDLADGVNVAHVPGAQAVLAWVEP